MVILGFFSLALLSVSVFYVLPESND